MVGATLATSVARLPNCDYKTRDDARASLFDYMEVFYNRQRRHSSINYEAPLPFEAMKSPGKVSVVRG
jgi:transposase InsO family protein